MKINAIIFDLGKVIVEIDHIITLNALEKLSKDPEKTMEKISELEAFKSFELGKISEAEFLLMMKKILGLDQNESDKLIKEAWNAMILGVPKVSISLLENLKKSFRVYALTNTNITHLEAINQHLLVKYQIKNIKTLFNEVYCSHELGLCKPDPKIYEYVLHQNQLSPAETLFIDDNSDNIETAKRLKLQTILLQDQAHLTQELQKIGILI